jgi:hypothetical protein
MRDGMSRMSLEKSVKAGGCKIAECFTPQRFKSGAYYAHPSMFPVFFGNSTRSIRQKQDQPLETFMQWDFFNIPNAIDFHHK